MDHIEWDLLSPLTPEDFAKTVCKDVGLGGEAIPLVAHAVHEELMKHKKDAVEWGVIGGDSAATEEAAAGTGAVVPKDRVGQGFLKDKTGLGLGWGRAPKDGRGPKTLRSVWRDWAEAEEFRTKFEVLTAEEVERREWMVLDCSNVLCETCCSVCWELEILRPVLMSLTNCAGSSCMLIIWCLQQRRSLPS